MLICGHCALLIAITTYSSHLCALFVDILKLTQDSYLDILLKLSRVYPVSCNDRILCTKVTNLARKSQSQSNTLNAYYNFYAFLSRDDDNPRRVN